MNRTEYHDKRRKKFAELHKNRVDAAYEYFCALSDEEKQLSELAFARNIAAHMSISMGIARNVTNNLIAEYKVEFCKYKQNSSRSVRFTGHRHSAEARAAIAKSTIERNKARAIKCKEQGINYRNYRQDACTHIEVVNFCKARAKAIDSSKIII